MREGGSTKAVISVVGKDQIGIVHVTAGLLVDYHLNIIDISQTLMDDYLTTIMLVDLSQCQMDFDEVLVGFDALGEKMGLKIRVQYEDIFTAMHQI